MNPNNVRGKFINPQTRSLLLLLGLVAAASSIYLVVSAVIIAQTTGILRFSSSNPKATLAVSQADTQIVNIGIGRAGVHLKPGSYEVSARYNGYQSTGWVRIQASRTTRVTLELVNTKARSSSSLYGVTIQNTAALNNLLLPDQLTYVLQATGNYIINHVNQATQSATITSTMLNQDGSITYTVKTDTQPVSQIKITLENQPNGVIVFLVPAAGFSTTLNPY
jgi:hypothetical protein